jgi:CHASE2 domain-containing sensor protein/predicted Ser/Thr protein kinase
MSLAESQARRRQQQFSVGIALLCWALLAGAYLAGLFQTFDLKLLDWRFHLRGERQAADSIAIIAIDDATIRGYEGRWPLPRNTYAYLLTALEEAGARVIGFDVQLPENKALDPTADALLATVSSRYDNVVYAVTFDPSVSDSRGSVAVSQEELRALRKQGLVGDDIAAPRAATVSLPYHDLAVEARALGHVVVIPDTDGVSRRQPLLVRYGDRLYPALALRMAGLARGHVSAPEARATGGGVRVGWGRDATWTLALDREGATGIDFAGDRTAFPNTYSLLEVLQRSKAGDRRHLREAFSNRMVLIGLDSPQEVREDLGTTPFADASPGLFIHANVLDDLLRGRFLRPAPVGVYLAALGILAAFLGWIFSTRSVPASAFLAALALTVMAGVDFALFAGWAIDAPPVAVLALAPVIYVATGSFRYVFLERRAREREADIHEGRMVQEEFLPSALLGQKLSHYRILERLGAGGMGAVYLGLDERDGRQVAVKVLAGRALADQKSRRRFRREARALSKLRNPHIAAIYDFDSQDGVDFIAMEHVEGATIAEEIRRGPLREEEAVRIGIQVVEALVQAHANGVVHRDLKPGNVMLTRSGDAKVLDFGLAYLSQIGAGSETVTGLTETGQVVGTLPYMPPEILRGERFDPRGDLYSVGALLYEMLTGRRPFHGDTPQELVAAILNGTPEAPTLLNSRLSVAFEEIVLRALEKDPARRPQSAQGLLLELRGLAVPFSAQATRR